MLQDLKFGLKLLSKEKAFTITALLTLALCIGANTAVFTVLNAVVLEPLPYPEPDQLVTMYNEYPGVGVKGFGANGVPDYLDRRQLTDVFDSVALTGDSGYDVGGGATPQRVDGEYVTPDYFHVLRAQPMLGRTFTPEEATLGKEKVAVLSNGFWRQMFAGDRNVLGRDIRLSGELYRIVGVMPEGFGSVGQDTKLWVPFAFRPEQTTDDARHSNSWGMVARLKPGVTVAVAQRRIDALNKATLDRLPKIKKLLEDARFGTAVAGLKDELVKQIRPTLYLLQFAVGFVLLIGCVNIANLMLVRGNVRLKEVAIRFSLGAGKWRLARQLMTESVALGMMGGVLGVGLGIFGARLLARLGGDQLPRSATIQVDARVLAFSAIAAVLTGLIFGSVPVFHMLRRDLNEIFRGTSRTGTAERGAIWTRSALVVCQVSLAFVLLIGSALLTLSFARLLSVNHGFRPEHVMTARVSLPQARYKENATARSFIGGLLESIRALPGVKSAGATSYLPFSGNNNSSVISIIGYTRAPGENPPVPGFNRVDGGYFHAMGIPILQGRAFAESDSADAPKVVVIDQFLAKKYWPKGNPIGSRVMRGVPEIPGDDKTEWTVVGVAGSVKTGDLAEQNPVGQIYFPYQQDTPRSMHLVVKTDRDDPQLTTALRQLIQRNDPELPLYDVKTLPQRLSGSLVSRRAAMIVCAVFGALALLLSAIGIYGVLAYGVAQRTREFGIRVALGATVRDVLGMVTGHGLKLAGIGLAIGIAGAFALTRLMTSLLFDVKPTDPGVFAGVALTLAIVAFVASVIPSLRAMRIKPASALRYE